jgi:hypothetical protein
VVAFWDVNAVVVGVHYMQCVKNEAGILLMPASWGYWRVWCWGLLQRYCARYCQRACKAAAATSNGSQAQLIGAGSSSLQQVANSLERASPCRRRRRPRARQQRQQQQQQPPPKPGKRRRGKGTRGGSEGRGLAVHPAGAGRCGPGAAYPSRRCLRMRGRASQTRREAQAVRMRASRRSALLAYPGFSLPATHAWWPVPRCISRMAAAAGGP